jgi:hypothetical protein
VPEDGVEGNQELTHGGGERELLGFAGCDQALVERAQRRVMARVAMWSTFRTWCRPLREERV